MISKVIIKKSKFSQKIQITYYGKQYFLNIQLLSLTTDNNKRTFVQKLQRYASYTNIFK